MYRVCTVHVQQRKPARSAVMLSEPRTLSASDIEMDKAEGELLTSRLQTFYASDINRSEKANNKPELKNKMNHFLLDIRED